MPCSREALRGADGNRDHVLRQALVETDSDIVALADDVAEPAVEPELELDLRELASKARQVRLDKQREGDPRKAVAHHSARCVRSAL